MEIEIRYFAKYNCCKQRPPRFRLRCPQQIAQAPLFGQTLLQGTGVEKLRWLTSRPAVGAHGGIVVADGRELVALETVEIADPRTCLRKMRSDSGSPTVGSRCANSWPIWTSLRCSLW